MKIKTGDNVIVISGQDKGKKGKVLKALPKKNQVVVEGVRPANKNIKPNQNNNKGYVKDINLPLDASNVALLDSKGKASRVGYKVVDGKKVRVLKTTGEVVK